MTDRIGSGIQSKFICTTADADAGYSYLDAVCSRGCGGESGAIKPGDIVKSDDNSLFDVKSVRASKKYEFDKLGISVKVESIKLLDRSDAFVFPKLLVEAERRFNFRSLKKAGIIKKGDSLEKINAKLDAVRTVDAAKVHVAALQTRLAIGKFTQSNPDRFITNVAGFTTPEYPFYIFINKDYNNKTTIFHELTHIAQLNAHVKSGKSIRYEAEQNHEYFKDLTVEDQASVLELMLLPLDYADDALPRVKPFRLWQVAWRSPGPPADAFRNAGILCATLKRNNPGSVEATGRHDSVPFNRCAQSLKPKENAGRLMAIAVSHAIKCAGVQVRTP